MAWTCEEIVDHFGGEAQLVPGAIVVFRGKHIVVAEFGNGGSFVVTPAGLELLGDKVVAPKASKKPRKAVESANELVGEPDGIDLDM
jgi:hypothetical protein